jgi:hypothetical protein
MSPECFRFSIAITAQIVSRLLLSFPSCQPAGWDEKKVTKEKSRQNNASTLFPTAPPLFCQASAHFLKNALHKHV